MLPLKQFQCWSWLAMALSRPLKEDRWALPLSTPLSPRQSMVWCPWLCCPQVVWLSIKDLLPRWQKVRQSHARELSPNALTYVLDWVSTLLPCNSPFGIGTVLIFKCYGRQLVSNWCNLGGGSVWDVVVKPSPVRFLPWLWFDCIHETDITPHTLNMLPLIL